MRVLKGGLLAAVLGLLLLLVAAAFFYPQLPDTSSLSNYQPKQPLRVLTADGVAIGGFGAERRVYQRIDQIPQLMKDSLLAVEDARFYSHGGIDWLGVARAITAQPSTATNSGSCAGTGHPWLSPAPTAQARLWLIREAAAILLNCTADGM